MPSSNSPGRTGCSIISPSWSARRRRRRKRTRAAAQAFAHRAARLCADAGRHFNRGQRAFFFALGYLGWFFGPLPLALTTTGIVIVMWRRQFASDARLAFSQTPPGPRMT